MGTKRRKLTPEEREAAAEFRRLVEAMPESQHRLGAAIGVTQGMIWQWADGLVPISAAKARAAAIAVKGDPFRISVAFREVVGSRAEMLDLLSESVLKSVPEKAPPSHLQRPDPVTLRTALDLLAFDEDQAGPYSPPRQAERLAEIYARVAADGGVSLSDESNTQFDDEVWARVHRTQQQGKTEPHGTATTTKPGRNRG